MQQGGVKLVLGPITAVQIAEVTRMPGVARVGFQAGGGDVVLILFQRLAQVDRRRTARGCGPALVLRPAKAVDIA